MSVINSGNESGRVGSHRANAVVGEDRTIRLDRLPFPPGTAVHVYVLSRNARNPVAEGSLHGTVLRDADPFDPAVPSEQWDADR